MNLFNRNPGKKKTVAWLRPLDFRGEELAVKSESEKAVYCKTNDGKEKMFFNWGPAWTFANKILFFGVVGIPLTAHPSINGMKIPLKDFLTEVWPKGTYEKLNPTLKTPIESEMGVICAIDATLPDANLGLDKLEITSIMKESYTVQLKEFGKQTQKKDMVRENLITIIAMILSFFVGAFAVTKGWI